MTALNIEGLLEYFNLEDNEENIKLLCQNLHLLQDRQTLYRLQSTYPGLHYVVLHGETPNLVQIEPPPRTLETLETIETRSNFETRYYTLATSTNNFQSFVYFDICVADLLTPYKDYRPYISHALYKTDNDLWYKTCDVNISLTWLLRHYPSRLKLYLDQYEYFQR